MRIQATRARDAAGATTSSEWRRRAEMASRTGFQPAGPTAAMPAALPSRSTAPAARQSEPALFSSLQFLYRRDTRGRTAASASSFGGACWRCIVGELQGCAFVEQHLQVFELIEPRRRLHFEFGCAAYHDAYLDAARKDPTHTRGRHLVACGDITGLADEYQPR